MTTLLRASAVVCNFN